MRVTVWDGFDPLVTFQYSGKAISGARARARGVEWWRGNVLRCSSYVLIDESNRIVNGFRNFLFKDVFVINFLKHFNKHFFK